MAAAERLSIRARDAGLSRADDIEIMNYAVKNDSILVTKDLEFANLYSRTKSIEQ